MVKILVADDERPIREWVKFCIQKNFGEKFQVFLAANGQEAIKIFNQNKPEIVFTDIKMPAMDGLTLSERIQASAPDTDIIVLTSYSNFDYVRKALKQNVVDYILKTEITQEQICEIVTRLIREKKSKTDTAILPQSYEAANICELLKKAGSDKDLLMEIFEELDMQAPKPPYFCFAIKTTQENKRPFFPTRSEINLVFAIPCRDDIVLCCAGLAVKSNLLQLQLIHNYINELYNINDGCIISSSQPQDDLLRIGLTLETSINNLSMNFYDGNPVIFCMDTKNDCTVELNKYYLKLIKLLKYQNRESITNALNDFFAFIYNYRPTNVSTVKMLCKKICENINSILYEKDHVSFTRENAKIIDKIDRSTCFSDLRQIVESESNKLFAPSANMNNYSSSIQKAIEYIKENYRTITGLNEVANHIFLNPEYFSRLFKEETGYNFSTYLNNYRLKKSLELMPDKDKKVYQIAEEVGFSSLSYYSRKFKERFGINPFKYRSDNLHVNST